MDDLLIRSETPGDRPAIRRVNELAFGRAAEADLVDALRIAARPFLSMVAEQGGGVVGHVAFTPVTIDGGSDTDGSYVTGMVDMPQTLAPANGCPPPSTAMIPFTRLGRASATSQPNGPPAEWVMMIAGPILSSNIAPR